MSVEKSLPLSVIILTKNESDRIRDCIESVRWATDIVVVDDESTDDTVQIAESLGARVLHRKMEIEGTHRNWAYAQASQEWVFSLDADERITPELAAEITELLTNNPQADGYTVPRRNYLGKTWIRHGGWYPSAQLKLFRRDKFRYEETEVHPRAFMDSDAQPLQGDLIHYSYRDLSDFLGKLNRQTTLEVKKWLKDGRKMGVGRGLRRTIDRFFRSWRGKEGHKDGFVGYLVAVYAGLYQFLSYAKYWVAKQAESTPTDSIKRAPSSAPPQKKVSASKLSAVILTKNAIESLPNCLDSLQWVEDLILVDGGSTDGTVEVGQAAGAKIVTDLTQDNFGHLRNRGAEAAQGEWVLQLDADEVVTEEFKQALLKIIESNPPKAAYKFRRRNNFLGHWMRFGGWDHQSLHLFRKGKARYEGLVHEKLLVDGPIGSLKVGVEHTPFRSLEEFINRHNRYTTLEAQQILKEQPNVSMKTIRYQTQRRPLKLFWKVLVKKQGIREGMYGFLFAGLFSFVHFLKWAKVWELVHDKEKNSTP